MKKDYIHFAFLYILAFFCFFFLKGIVQKLNFIVEKLKEPCAVYDVATDYVIISEKDIVGINKKEK